MRPMFKAALAAISALFIAAPAQTRTLDEFIATASTEPESSQTFSCWQTKYPDANGDLVITPWVHNLFTSTASGYQCGYDWLAKAMGMGPSFAFATAQGTLTSVTGTSATNTGAAFPTAGQGLAGCLVVVGANSSGTGSTVYGVITTNSATVLTVDQWYSGTSTTGAAGTTPNGTGQYIILPGQNPAAWMCLSISVFTPSTADTSLNSQGAELAANGFSRAVGTYAHTAAATTYTLIHLWTATGTDTINNEGISGAATLVSNNGGVFPFESAEPSPPTLVSGDTLQNTVTVTI
jgi:hypothetical protein